MEQSLKCPDKIVSRTSELYLLITSLLLLKGMWKPHSIHAKYSICCCTVRQRPIRIRITEGKERSEERSKCESSITWNCWQSLRGVIFLCDEGADDKFCVSLAICPLGNMGESREKPERQPLIELSFECCRICMLRKQIWWLAKDKQRMQSLAEHPQINKTVFVAVNWRQFKQSDTVDKADKFNEVAAGADKSIFPEVTLFTGI